MLVTEDEILKKIKYKNQMLRQVVYVRNRSIQWTT